MINKKREETWEIFVKAGREHPAAFEEANRLLEGDMFVALANKPVFNRLMVLVQMFVEACAPQLAKEIFYPEVTPVEVKRPLLAIDYRTLPANCDSLECPICTQIYTDPVETPCNGKRFKDESASGKGVKDESATDKGAKGKSHVFCRKCLEAALHKKPNCPICRGSVTGFQPSVETVKALKDLRIECHFCRASIKHSSLKSHLEIVCPKAPICCPNMNCSANLPRDEIQAHLDGCLERSETDEE